MTAAEALNAHGAARAAAGDRAAALAAYTAAIALDPTLAAAFNNRAVARLEVGDLDAALADLREAVRLNPALAVAYDNCATVHDRRREYAAAVACHDRAIALYTAAGDRPRRLCVAYVLRAVAFHHLGQARAAAADLRAAYRVRPRLAAATAAAVVARNAHDPAADPVAECDEHLARHPGDGFALGRRALTHLARGDRAAYAADAAAAAWLLAAAEDVTIFHALARAVAARAPSPAPAPGA